MGGKRSLHAVGCVNQNPTGLIGGANLCAFAPNTNKWLELLGLNKNLPVTYWLPNRGALGEVWSITLPVGTLVDRYGYPGGNFVSPVGTQYELPKSVKSYIEAGHLEEVKIGKC